MTGLLEVGEKLWYSLNELLFGMKNSVLFFFVISSFYLTAQNGNLDDMCFKIVKDQKGLNHCLKNNSGTVEQLFNALPKIPFYRYGFSDANNYEERVKDKSLTVFYPTYSNSAERFELIMYIPTYKERVEMVVTFTDLDLMDVLNYEESLITKEETKKMFARIEQPIPQDLANLKYESYRIKMIDFHKVMYENAKKTNLDYYPSQGAGNMVPDLKMAHIENPFISYNDVDKQVSFASTYADRYSFRITMKYVDGIHSCSSAASYLRDYLSQIDFASLDRTIYFNK